MDHSGLKSQKNVQFSKIPQHSLYYYFFSIFDPLWDFFLYLIVTIFNSITFDILITIINHNYSKPDTSDDYTTKKTQNKLFAHSFFMNKIHPLINS